MASNNFYFHKHNDYVSHFIGELIKKSIKQVYVHPVRYELVWDKQVDFSELESGSRFDAIFYVEKFNFDTYKEFIKQKHAASIGYRQKQYQTQLFDTLAISLPKDILALAKSIEWNTVLFPHTELYVQSSSTGNDDVKGGGCGNINLSEEDFTWQKDTPHGITLRDLTEGVYRMKGAKYDWQYELVGGLEINSPNQNWMRCDISFKYRN